jgi:hypothetical protein
MTRIRVAVGSGERVRDPVQPPIFSDNDIWVALISKERRQGQHPGSGCVASAGGSHY